MDQSEKRRVFKEFAEIVKVMNKTECRHCGGTQSVEPHCRAIDCGWVYCSYCRHVMGKTGYGFIDASRKSN